jgi:hypothetical protein
MYIEVDFATVPPTSALRDATDFTEFKIVVAGSEHAYVGVDSLVALAGERGDDAAWREQLDAMVAYAQTQGWVGEDGAVRAHVEWPA